MPKKNSISPVPPVFPPAPAGPRPPRPKPPKPKGTRAKVVAEIERIAKAAGVDADFEWSWANIAHVYFRRGFETVANAHIDFQSGYLSAAVNRGTRKAEYFGKPDTLHRVSYEQAGEFALLFAAVKKAIGGAR